jgi:hypothetical protein
VSVHWAALVDNLVAGALWSIPGFITLHWRVARNHRELKDKLRTEEDGKPRALN